MREIKFRVWDKETKKMFDVTHLQLDVNNAKPTFVAFDEQPAASMGYWDTFENMDEIELLQYTGFKDKNGKEIYDGHIVSVKYLYDKRTTDRAQVVWREDKASFGLKSLKGLTNEVYELYQVTAEHNLEIIGNIYENPELLKDNL